MLPGAAVCYWPYQPTGLWQALIADMRTPIEIVGLRASLDAEGVMIEWETFQAHRYTRGSIGLEPIRELGLVPAASLATGLPFCSLRDASVESGLT